MFHKEDVEGDSNPLGSLLGMVCRLNYARVHRVFEKIGLYRGQPPMLHALWHKDGLMHSELAHMLHVQPATISNMVRRMEKAGFVTRRRDDEDERVSRVYLTDRGRAIQEEVYKTMRAIEAIVFAGFAPEELESIRGFLERMAQNLKQMEEGEKQ